MNRPSATDTNPERRAFASVERRLWDAYDLDIDEQYITLSDPDIRIRTLAAGEGDPLLFVHGGASYASSFIPLVARLTDHRCLLFDRPACGLSDGFDYQGVNLGSHATEVLVGVLDELGFDRVPMVGHSMGGNWILWLAERRPERIESIVLQGAVGNLLDMKMPISSRAPALLRRVLSPLGIAPIQAMIKLVITMIPIEQKVLTLFSSTPSTDHGRMIYRGLGHKKDNIDQLPDALLELDHHHIEIPSVQRSLGSLLNAIGGVRGARPGLQMTVSTLADIETTTRFVWGENDIVYGPEYGQRAAEIMPAADTIVVPGGHLPWLDEPEQCAQLTREIVEG
jgi:pimeloyl-ACP methyl ester carboxylesterase